MSTITHFRHEYEAHIRDKACSAGVCQALISYHIDPNLCAGCGACEKNCPADAISKTEREVFVIDQDKCVKCGVCVMVCPDKFQAIRKRGRVMVAEAV